MHFLERDKLLFILVVLVVGGVGEGAGRQCALKSFHVLERVGTKVLFPVSGVCFSFCVCV